MTLTQSRITPAIKADFDENGFAIVPNVLDEAKLAHFRTVFDTLVDDNDAQMDKEGIEQRGLTIKGKKYFIGFPHLDYPELKKALFNDTMADVVNGLIGGDAWLYWDQCVIKYKDEKSSFAWHQDSGYGPVERPHKPYLTCWLALDDVTVENGTVYMLPYDKEPKSRDHIEHVWSDKASALVGYAGDEPGMPVIMKAGSLAVFTSYTLHRSGANTNGKPRRVYYIAYSPQEMRIGQDANPNPGGNSGEPGELYGHNRPFLKGGVRVDGEPS